MKSILISRYNNNERRLKSSSSQCSPRLSLTMYLYINIYYNPNMKEDNKQALWVQPDIHKKFKQHCDHNGLKMSYVVQTLIEEHINAES